MNGMISVGSLIRRIWGDRLISIQTMRVGGSRSSIFSLVRALCLGIDGKKRRGKQ